MYGVADETAPEVADSGQQAGDGTRLQPDVVVDVEHVPRPRPGEQVRPVLGHPAPGLVPLQQHRMPEVAQYPHHAGDGRVGPGWRRSSS